MSHSIIFFDGVCNLCNSFVQFVIARDNRDIFRFCSLQSPKAQELLAEFQLEREKFSTVVLLQDSILSTRSNAVLKILEELDGWQWTRVFILIPSPLRDAIYNLTARYRYTIFGKRATCMTPASELRLRFVDPRSGGIAEIETVMTEKR